MNKMHSFARVVLVGLAGYFGVIWFMNLIRGIYMVFLEPELLKFNLGQLFSSLLVIAFTVMVIIFILVNLDKLAGWVVKRADLFEPESQFDWVGVLFHLLFVCVGLLFLLYFFRGLGSIVAMLLRTQEQGRLLSDFMGRGYYVLGQIVLLAAGVYLLLGAPGFIRWQVRRVKELCSAPAVEEGAKD